MIHFDGIACLTGERYQGKGKGAAFESLGQNPKAVTVPEQNFQSSSVAPDEHKSITAIGIMGDLMLDQVYERIE
jgi:hypothetical protein